LKLNSNLVNRILLTAGHPAALFSSGLPFDEAQDRRPPASGRHDRVLRRACLFLVLCLTLCSCGDVGPAPRDVVEDLPPSCSQPSQLTLVATDAWGRIFFQRLITSKPKACTGFSAEACLALQPGDSEVLSLSADGYVARSLNLGIDLDIPGNPISFELDERDTPSALAHPPESGGCSFPVLFVALSHEWFADSGKAPSRNKAEFFFCGQDFFGALYNDLKAAATAVSCATWWWQSDFELYRPEADHPLMTAEERWENTAMKLLQDKPDVTKKVIVSRFASETMAGLAYMNTDITLRERAYDVTDNFEVLIQGNPTEVPLMGNYEPVQHTIPYVQRIHENNPEYSDHEFDAYDTLLAPLETAEAASWHQKVWVIDGKTAYISGMNVKSTDWDTPQHGLFEARRMKFISSAEERQKVLDRLAFSDVGPRKDAGIRLVGPAARQVDECLASRWEWGRERGDMFHEFTTPFELLPAAGQQQDGVMAQIVVTTPEPFGERSILETHEKAILNAEELIFIEDQYFRMPVLFPVFQQAFANNPDLYLVVITVDVSPLDGAKKWTLDTDAELRKMAGDRYLLLQLKVFDGEGMADGSTGPIFQPMDVHTKVLIVDQQFLTVGSCNKNNRGLLYEGEMNAVVLDEAFVSEARGAFLANITGKTDFPWKTASGLAVRDHLEYLAQANAAIEAQVTENGTWDGEESPSGFVYPLEFTTGYYIDCGPDAF